ncbi:hypothetical protein [Fluviicola taffensis]|uniref:DUF2599 domain-containing protein n=1 Tax=Fluviicola taffensis (strain DSM 16823 / NCIMB 13979 / RW262) TaxID=755732 RepID=F2IBV4_FLUTR|nr:hypothetical protein [Fluviicola taffensis]AEA42182.1 hypothetical protein Fluta_0173 [Fluviicola taffensis DSM 16823]
MKKIIFLLIVISSTTLKAQETFEWYEGTCYMKAQIDTSKATYNQIQNAHYTLIQASDLSQPFLAYQVKDTTYMNVKGIQFECGNFLNELDKMDYPKGEYWTKIKKEKANNLREQCLLHEKAVIALTNPKALKGTPYCKECSEYISALEKGGEILLKLWKKMTEEEIATANNPELLSKTFEQSWNSPNNEFIARLEVLRYGWWNCVLQNQKEWFSENLYKAEFQKLMISITPCN